MLLFYCVWIKKFSQRDFDDFDPIIATLDIHTVNDRISPHSRISPLPNKPPPPKPILTNKPPLPNKPPFSFFFMQLVEQND